MNPSTNILKYGRIHNGVQKRYGRAINKMRGAQLEHKMPVPRISDRMGQKATKKGGGAPDFETKQIQ